MDQQQKWLLKKFHTLCSRLGMTDDEKHALVESFGVESSKDIDNHDLMDICHTLEMQLNPALKELDQQRRRTMAAIGSWLRLTGREDNASVIKGIACRATGYQDFNKIPADRLKNICYAFNQKTKDSKAVDSIAQEYLAMATAMKAQGTPAGKRMAN